MFVGHNLPPLLHQGPLNLMVGLFLMKALRSPLFYPGLKSYPVIVGHNLPSLLHQEPLNLMVGLFLMKVLRSPLLHPGLKNYPAVVGHNLPPLLGPLNLMVSFISHESSEITLISSFVNVFISQENSEITPISSLIEEHPVVVGHNLHPCYTKVYSI